MAFCHKLFSDLRRSCNLLSFRVFRVITGNNSRCQWDRIIRGRIHLIFRQNKASLESSLLSTFAHYFILWYFCESRIIYLRLSNLIYVNKRSEVEKEILNDIEFLCFCINLQLPIFAMALGVKYKSKKHLS